MVFIGVAFGFFGNMLNVDPHVSGSLIIGVTFVAAAVLTVIALWLKPVWLAAFNGTIMVALVITAATLVFPRFDATDTMRQWQSAVPPLLKDNPTVILYKPERWAEYGLQYYLFNRVHTIFTPQELLQTTAAEGRVLCITDEKTLDEVSHIPDVDLEVVHAIGEHTAFWAWQVK